MKLKKYRYGTGNWCVPKNTIENGNVILIDNDKTVVIPESKDFGFTFIN